jgi:hypothetical protein
MLYAIYGPDGSIHQANKVYDPDNLNYDNQLNDLGYQFLKVESPGLLPPDEWYVNVSLAQLRERPIMSTIEINKKIIKYGPNDSCLATGIPKQAKVTITLRDGTEIYAPFVLDAEQLEISIPVPCVYRVFLELWPYRTFQYEIEATT